MKVFTRLCVASVLLVASIVASAGEAGEADDKKSTEDDTWKSLGFGIGLSYTVDTGKHDRVKTASVVDGIVRVSEDSNGIPRMVMEGHYFFDSPKSSPNFGFGPFVAVQPGDNEIISAAALGIMFGFRHIPDGADPKTVTRSWNIGIGVAADPGVQILGDGITPNAPLPGKETEVRFKKTTQYGVILVFSTSW